ncbi:hypothetical protein PIB30_069753 [Stylosanthes scabra]|uniref:Uncharacterized protein n=1 Tax=Stylosanthes scabra TaxID=79078 RepID=A0ABU6UM40_9FABA|nr:hypothetical protein [Stylosanthes scabra]
MEERKKKMAPTASTIVVAAVAGEKRETERNRERERELKRERIRERDEGKGTKTLPSLPFLRRASVAVAVAVDEEAVEITILLGMSRIRSIVIRVSDEEGVLVVVHPNLEAPSRNPNLVAKILNQTIFISLVSLLFLFHLGERKRVGR